MDSESIDLPVWFRFFIIVIILAACGSPVKPTQTQPIIKAATSYLPDTGRHFPVNTIELFNRFWNKLHSRTHFSGVNLFYSKGKFYEWHAGLADSHHLLHSHMPMQIASISKTFGATAIMLLIQNGKIHLSDSLRQFFPELPYYNISIENLLSHSSGLPEYTWFCDVYYKDSGRLTNKKLIELMASEKPDIYFKPGRRHRYTNTNFVLIASIVEKVSGHSYPEFLQQYIFNPLGMMDTRVLSDSENFYRLPVQGQYADGKYYGMHYQDGTYGDKNIVSTVWDLFLFYKGLKENKIISETLRDEMFKTRWPNARRGTGYALGWRKRKFENETWMFHSGWWHGFRTNFYFNIQRDECAVILSNRLSGGFIPGNLIVAMFHPEIRNKWLGIREPETENISGEED